MVVGRGGDVLFLMCPVLTDPALYSVQRSGRYGIPTGGIWIGPIGST